MQKPKASLIIFFLSIVISVVFFIFIPKPDSSLSQNETVLSGKIEKITQTRNTQFEQRQYIQQELLVSIPNSEFPITVSTEYIPKNSPNIYKEGDHILVGTISDDNDEGSYFLIGYDRTKVLTVLVGIFVLLAVLVTKQQGLKAIGSMLYSFSVILFFILPLILKGIHPLLVSIIGIIFIIPISFSLTHGINKKTVAAVIGTITSLVVTGLIAAIVINLSNLSGITSEEVEVLFYSTNQTINLSGILLAGILIGALGILDDVAISQASIVLQLKEASPKLSGKDLFKRAMIVGRDHISSVINTLVLVYTGASLSTLLLFLIYPRPLIVLLNSEMVVIQIVIALIGSIGLILTVPITTYIATYGLSIFTDEKMLRNKNKKY